MAINSKIEWCSHTLNLWWGCEEVHRGCDNCYARVLANRWGKELWGGEAPREMKKNHINDLVSMDNKAKAAGESATVFIGSMMDIFEKSKPLLNPLGSFENTGQLRDNLFTSISNGRFQNLIFLFLTKRPSNINKMIPEAWKENPRDDVWYGASVVDRKSMMDVARHMDKVVGKAFWSVEPLLEEIDITEAFGKYNKKPDWIIVGGESGHGRRPFKLEWAELIRKECERRNIPFFFKQIDKVQTIPEEMMIRQFPKEFLIQ